mgnify:FL=1
MKFIIYTREYNLTGVYHKVTEVDTQKEAMDYCLARNTNIRECYHTWKKEGELE